jgi:hypothetical protein
MTLTKEMSIFLKDLDDAGANISTLSNVQILFEYYETLGVNQDTTFREWILGTAQGKYPAYSSVTRSIRLCRQRHPAWRKSDDTAREQIRAVKKEEGR